MGRLLPKRFQMLYAVNAVVGVVQATRWAGDGAPPWSSTAVPGAVAALLLWGGLYYFRRVETLFAHLI